jgi:hypothetical protein
MPAVLEHVITRAIADPGTHRVMLTWANSATTVAHFERLVGKGVLAVLADPLAFPEVRIGARGRSLEWPGEIDCCADALWFEAHPEDAPEHANLEQAR